MTQQTQPAPGAALMTDHWRPRYHITGARNWINDPNGPVHWYGRYHVFFQANPVAPFWGPPNWGHVSSKDLVRWTRHEMALAPDSSGPDVDGCWSGCVRDVGGRPAIYYTGVVGEDDGRVESVCRAWGSADLTAWTKDPANPLIPAPPAELGSGYHRDPFLWHDGERWQMLLGSGALTGERHGQILRYESADGTSWEYRGIFFAAPRSLDGVDLGEHWECPQLWFDGDQVALIVSCQVPGAARPLMHSVYFTGSIVDGRYSGELGGLLDHGDVFYAPALTTDVCGRTVLWGWAQESVSSQTQTSMRHVGALSLPRTMSFNGSRVDVAAAPELQRLRLDPIGARELASGARTGHPAVELSGALLAGGDGWTVTAGAARLKIAADDTGTAVNVQVTDHIKSERVLTLPSEPARSVETKAYIDGSLVEVFAAGRALATRVYWPVPTLGLTAVGSVRAWSLDRTAVGT